MAQLLHLNGAREGRLLSIVSLQLKFRNYSLVEGFPARAGADIPDSPRPRAYRL